MINKSMWPIPEGAVFVASEGEYSNYGIVAVYKAKVSIDMEYELSKWLKTNPDEHNTTEFGGGIYHCFEYSPFLMHLEVVGMIEQIPHWETHHVNNMTIHIHHPTDGWDWKNQ